jgi:hypothetical protein
MLSETKHLGLSYKKKILHSVQNDTVSLLHALDDLIIPIKKLASLIRTDKIYIPIQINHINRG